MTNIIDARGLACPQPVINTKKALEAIEEGLVTVVVDNVAARDNVRRFAESQGLTVTVEEKEGDYHLNIAKGFACEIEPRSEGTRENDNIVVYINSTTAWTISDSTRIRCINFINNFLTTNSAVWWINNIYYIPATKTNNISGTKITVIMIFYTHPVFIRASVS